MRRAQGHVNVMYPNEAFKSENSQLITVGCDRSSAACLELRLHGAERSQRDEGYKCGQQIKAKMRPLRVHLSGLDRSVGSAAMASREPTWRFASASRTLSPLRSSRCALAATATCWWTRSAAASTPLLSSSRPSRSCPATARRSTRAPSPSARRRRPTHATPASKTTNTTFRF